MLSAIVHRFANPLSTHHTHNTTHRAMKIHTTTNYAQFKQLTGNRSINKSHKAKLMESMRKNYRFTVITVNERNEVIDGQHRLSCAKELGLPVHYVVCEGYGLNDVQQLNANLKRWTTNDYLDGYCEMGNEEYLFYRSFKSTFGLGHKECLRLLTGTYNGESFDDFREGNFVVKHRVRAMDFAEKIVALEDLYPGVRRQAFVYAMIDMLELPQFDYDRFRSKLERQRAKMHDCSTSAQYKDLIETIYNFYTSDKVNLRFA